ncbi:dihydroorotase, partial [Corallococcus exiguus]|nr:dihydroorotase [Corallococcus exiguus]
MTADRPLLLKNARLVDPDSGREERGGVLVNNGLIQDVGHHVTSASDAEIVDCEGLVLAPGLIDMRAFIGEPGAAHRETFKSAGEAAAAGGVTTIVTMPETNPVLDDPAIIDFFMRRA